MTDEQLAAMHRLLADYHRKLAREAALDVVQKYHADLARRFADEAAQTPRRTATLEPSELEKSLVDKSRSAGAFLRPAGPGYSMEGGEGGRDVASKGPPIPAILNE